ncbi:MAG: ABA4-like family protein [Sphingomonadaceae bacterium]
MLTPVQIVEWGNLFALPGWIILIFFPRQWTAFFRFPEMVVPLVLGFVYGGVMLSIFGRVDGGFGSFAEIKALFLSDHMIAAGWIHYLAFDQFVGAWIARRADEIGLPRLIQAPILALTFMFGPAGYALFILARSALSVTSRPSAAS